MTAPTPHRAAVEVACLAVLEMSVEDLNKPRVYEGALIRAYLAAMEAAGWRMVPRVATEEMVEVGRNDLASPASERLYPDDMESKYQAMLSAAPPPEGGGG